MGKVTVAWDALVIYTDYNGRTLEANCAFDDYGTALDWAALAMRGFLETGAVKVTGSVAERTADRSGI